MRINFSIFILLIAISLSFFNCKIEYGSDNASDSEDFAGKNSPNSISTDVKIVIYNEIGEESATIFGDKAEFIGDDALLDNMKVLFKSNEDGTIKYSELVSDYGKINLGSRIEAWGNVIMIKKDEFRLETEKIIWEKRPSQGKNSSNGILKTEPEKLVTIYYADGSVIKGKNGVWEQGNNMLILEDTYTQTDTSAKNNSFFSSTSSNSNTKTPNSPKIEDTTKKEIISPKNMDTKSEKVLIDEKNSKIRDQSKEEKSREGFSTKSLVRESLLKIEDSKEEKKSEKEKEPTEKE